ncbi:MAG: tetratricopeptide repeat protein [Pirellulaceae bacterium]|nr:tetratricopeptide repeat protein [Pirellulaceae bacterium]
MRKSVGYLSAGIIIVAVGVSGALFIAFRKPDLRVDTILAAYKENTQYGSLTIHYPFDQTLFPPEIVPPNFRWEDSRSDSDAWLVTIEFGNASERMSVLRQSMQWTPSEEEWEAIKRQSLGSSAKFTVLGVNRARQEKVLSGASISISTSKHEVGAPIFYREVNLPFIEAVKEPSRIRWRFGVISSPKRPPIVLEKLPVCGNCHSFSADGTILGMDVDYANDKGSYAIQRVEEEMTLDRSCVMTWNDYKKEDKEQTFGLLSQVSPDGKYVVSTVKDRSVFVATPDLAFSQLFFPIKGILAIYSRETRAFHALPGADDRQFVHSNATWSPDGKYIVFARSKVHHLKNIDDTTAALLTPEQCAEFLRGGKTFLFDLYRIPFNDGKGGKPEPLEGASHNGMSNYFAKYSPDGKWIIFCKARSFMLLQPDSELYIVASEGGKARKLGCNTGRMNSWHSWSPNSRWLVFSSKANSPYTQLFLTHIDEQGRSSPAVLLSQFTAHDRAANIPEFVNVKPGAIKRIREQFVDDHSYMRAGNYPLQYDDLPAAARAYQKALQLNPRNADALNNMGLVLMEQEKFEEARTYIAKAIEYRPDHKESYQNLGIILYNQHKLQEAVAQWHEALRIDPNYFEAHVTLGLACLEVSKFKEANDHFRNAIRLSPSDPFMQYHVGLTFYKQGDHTQAAVHYSLALEIKPDHFESLLGLATIRATSQDSALRDGEEAVQLATKACNLTQYQDPMAMTTLSEAYAEAGRFADAMSAAQRALQIARETGNEDLANGILQTIERYRQRKSGRQSDPR